MKASLAFLLLLLLGAGLARAQDSITFKGGLISAQCALPVGGDWVMTVSLTGSAISASTSIDCRTIARFTGTYNNTTGKVTGSSAQGHVLTGRLGFKNGYPSFRGQIRGGGCTYKVQALALYFP